MPQRAILIIGMTLWSAGLVSCAPPETVSVRIVPKALLEAGTLASFAPSVAEVTERQVVLWRLDENGETGTRVEEIPVLGHLEVAESNAHCQEDGNPHKCDGLPARTEICDDACLCPQALQGGWWSRDHIVVSDAFVATLNEVERAYVLERPVCATPTSQDWVNGVPH